MSVYRSPMVEKEPWTRWWQRPAGGKAPIGVASVAKRHHVPVIGIAGVLGDGVEVVHRHGIDAVFSILPRLAPLPEVLANGEQNLYHSACNIARVIKLGQDIGTR